MAPEKTVVKEDHGFSGQNPEILDKSFQLDPLTEKILGQVNMTNTCVKLATGDGDLLAHLQDTVIQQQSVLQKREKLLLAIINNVNYLKGIHHKNKGVFIENEQRMVVIEKENEELKKQNVKLTKERDGLLLFK